MARTIGLLAAALAALVIDGGAAGAADPVSLRFAYPAPPQGRANEWGFTPWTKEVGEASGGTVEIKIFPGTALGDYRNVFDRTITGVADLAYGVFSQISSDFPKTMVNALPFESLSVEESSLALWRLYERGVIASEFTKVKLLCLFDFPDNGFHSRKPIATAADLRGMKLSVGTRILGDIVEKLGASPISLQPLDYYPSVQRGMVEGLTTSWPAVFPFKLQEVTTFHLDAPLGPAPAFVVMNKDSFARLPDRGKQAIEKLSGEHFVRRMASASDRMDREGRDAVLAMPGQTVAKLDPAEGERWKQRLAPITEGWVKATPDGAAVLAAYRAEIAKIRKGGS